MRIQFSGCASFLLAGTRGRPKRRNLGNGGTLSVTISSDAGRRSAAAKAAASAARSGCTQRNDRLANAARKEGSAVLNSTEVE